MKTLLFQRARLAVAALLLWAPVQAAFAQDFSLFIQNTNAALLVPGTTASFIINLSSLEGFATNVTLSTGTLPTGVTATFTPNPVKVTPSSDQLPTTSILTLTAASTIQAGSFPLDVTAIGGGITNMTSTSVSVQFGLVPNCFGAFVGEVTDAGTGLPIPNVSVMASYSQTFYTNTDANGLYGFTNLPLFNNNVTPYTIQAVASNYYDVSLNSQDAVCDGTNTVNLQLVRMLFGSISGNLSVQGGGPIPGGTVSIYNFFSNYSTNVVTDGNGNFSAGELPLENDNMPGNYLLAYSAPGFWPVQGHATIYANSNTVVAVVAVPICYDTVVGTVLFQDTLLPATNLTVFCQGGLATIFGVTDSSGNYSLTNVALGDLNTPLNTDVQSTSPPQYYGGNSAVTLSNCGVTVVAPTIYLPPVPKTNYGSLSGHIYSLTTGLPLTNAYINEGAAMTDSNGVYLYTNIMIGTGGTINLPNYQVIAQAVGYFTSVSNVTLHANTTVTQDFYLLPVGYGYVTGTVRDSATTLPLPGFEVGVGGISTYTDGNGNYSSGPIALSTGNLPTSITVIAFSNGYYNFTASTKITNGVTNIVNLFPIKICTGATIVGTVVNAVTQQPITNATVYVGNYPAQLTDSNGNFILTNITVGNDNSPILTTVNASAPGFNPQSHNVTIFCDATITTEFGAPQTAFGTIQGYVTNSITGLPLYGAFIGSEFGEATMTDTNGFYQLTQAPLGANNSSRTWTVTAIPTNFIGQTLSVTVSSNATSTLNFGFGMPPTHLLVTDASTTNIVTVGSNLVYTITLTNNGADAANVVLNDQLASTVTFVSASIVNPPGGSFTAPVYSNGVVTTSATNFADDAAVFLTITAIPTVPGTITNLTSVTSFTADTDPTGASRTAMVTNTVAAPVVIPANLAVAITSTTNIVTVGSNLVYDITLNNSGADAANVVLSDQLPPGVTFVNASIVNPPGGSFTAPALANGVVTTTGSTLAAGANLVLIVTVVPPVPGTLTNTTTATSSTPEVNPGTSRTAMVINTAAAAVVLPANLAVAITSTTNVVTVGSNLVYDVTLNNSGAAATNVVLSDQLPPNVTFVNASIVNPPGGLFTSPVFANGVITTTGPTLATAESLVLVVTVIPTASGTLTNITTVTSSTPEANPAATNRMAMAINLAAAPMVLSADLGLTATAAPNPIVVSNQLTYLLSLTNSGPASAPGVVLDDILPTNSLFISASNSQGSFTQNGTALHWALGTITNGGNAQVTFVITPLVVGLLTNSATTGIGGGVIDPNPANNTASAVVTVNATPPAPSNVSLVAGNITFNPQTGLFEQSLQFNNLSAVAATAVRVAVLGLPATVTLINASGSTNGVPYVEYDYPVPAGGTVNFALEYYSSTRLQFVSTNFVATIVNAILPPLATGTMVNLDQLPTLHNGQFLIEFASIPGTTYVIEYSTNMVTWQSTVPPIVATASRVQWIDAGPPKTVSAPGAVGGRLYRVIQVGGTNQVTKLN